MSNEQDRWRTLAEELGLPFDEEPAQAAPPPPRPTTPAVEKPAPVFEPEPSEPEPEETVEDVDLRPMAPLDAPSLDLREDTLVEDAAPEEAAAPAEEGRPRGRGRRRGRRGRRGDRPAEEPVQPTAAAAPPEAMESVEDEVESERDMPDEAIEEKEEQSQPRSGRGRKLTVRSPRQEEKEPEENVSVADDEDDSFEELLANWNVPSWAELIGSLYRPDR